MVERSFTWHLKNPFADQYRSSMQELAISGDKFHHQSCVQSCQTSDFSDLADSVGLPGVSFPEMLEPAALGPRKAKPLCEQGNTELINVYHRLSILPFFTEILSLRWTLVLSIFAFCHPIISRPQCIPLGSCSRLKGEQEHSILCTEGSSFKFGGDYYRDNEDVFKGGRSEWPCDIPSLESRECQAWLWTRCPRTDLALRKADRVSLRPRSLLSRYLSLRIFRRTSLPNVPTISNYFQLHIHADDLAIQTVPHSLQASRKIPGLGAAPLQPQQKRISQRSMPSTCWRHWAQILGQAMLFIPWQLRNWKQIQFTSHSRGVESLATSFPGQSQMAFVLFWKRLCLNHRKIDQSVWFLKRELVNSINVTGHL